MPYLEKAWVLAIVVLFIGTSIAFVVNSENSSSTVLFE